MKGAAVPLLLLLLGTAAHAQDAPATIEIQSPILIIDQDRLFSETHAGSAALDEIDRRAEALAAENQRIENELIGEERDLTEKRPGLSPEEFRKLADEFDAKVQRIRDEQDAKARDLTLARDEARNAFLRDSAGVISGIVREKGAVVVLDRRDVFLSADRIDITDEAIQRINEGADAPEQP